MRKILTFILLFCIGFLSPSAAGQDGFDVTVRGVVRDEVSRRPVAFVNVFLPGENIGTVTNGEGAFSLKIKSSNLEKVGLRFRCLEASFVVSYRMRGELFFLDYVKSLLRFRCEWKRRMFASAYIASSEMVVVDMDEAPASAIPHSESFGNRDYFDESAPCNWDRDFWKDFNIIEPTESLEKAAAKLSRLYRR